jgi:hypothetical protein
MFPAVLIFNCHEHPVSKVNVLKQKKIGVLVKKILLKWQERVREYFFLITRKLNSHLSKKSCLDYVCFSKSDL